MFKLELKMGADWVVCKVAETEFELEEFAKRTFSEESPFVYLVPDVLLTKWCIVPATEKDVKLWRWGYYR